MADRAAALAADLPLPSVRTPPTPAARWRRIAAKNPLGVLGTVLIALLVATAALAGLLAPFDPVAQIARRLTAPDGIYLLGTDEFGRDILSRIIFGTRISLYVGMVSVGIALGIGGTLGLIAGYFGGWIDNILMRLMDVMFSIPSLVLAIAITGILGPNLRNAMIAIGIVYTPTFARVARGPVLAVIQNEYIAAARTVGARDGRIIFRHVLPNVTAPIIVQTTLSLSTAILAEAVLSFLGLGTQPPEPSWGTMLGTGRKFMETAPWVAIFPGFAIMLAVLGFNLLGDGLRDALDPRLK
ncbi:MAG TPA: ABC transporter permease [Chloroflexota bacterium]|nr:ABC transporter permease [Chloroflexota bacterium]